MKTNNTDEELLQEIQRIIEKASLTEQIALTELLQRYELAVSVAKYALPGFPLGVLDFLSAAIKPGTFLSSPQSSDLHCNAQDKADEKLALAPNGDKYH
ncbi:Uncharacterised protein [Klebsiella variicola]|uniref:hypothetical protein n=1 Tax=Klebsiella TaxID=570 RepID=UPI000E2B0F0F|nr:MULTISPECIES: hypothetical protein [Klebsiella]NIG26579.1 hypothetical protein [Klebsiella sp. Acro-834]NIG40935.1 hypothetical protein [Klebsiella sp. Acro-833]SXE60639.1 Uncharacterised protein [Klebsiella variicola]HCB9205883.1 hypothetical protein [Klebsiella variicola]HDK6447330.1 hypothetical protein [Klebsiella variicola]